MGVQDEKFRKVAVNSVFLYIRFLLLALTDVVTIPFVLKGLGVMGYGVVSAVTGVALLFLAVLAVMETTAQRFISCTLGAAGREKNISSVFATVMSLSLLLAVVAVILGETVGLWFVRTRLNVAAEFLAVVPIVFRLGEAQIVLKLVQLPYAALIYSDERMSFFAKIGVLEAFGLIAAAVAAVLAGTGALVVYVTVMTLSVGVVFLVHVLYCRRIFSAVCLRVRLGLVRIGEMGRFLFWSCLSAAGNLLKYRGLEVALAVYAGVAFDATFESALRAGCLLAAISVGFRQASGPLIYKLWAGADRRELKLRLRRILAVTVGLVAVPGIPVMAFAPELMDWWLGAKAPPEIVAFVQCACVNEMADAFSEPLTVCIQATGKVALYHTMAFLLSAVGFCSAWLLLFLGFPAWTGFAAVVVSNVLAGGYRWLHVRLWVVREKE